MNTLLSDDSDDEKKIDSKVLELRKKIANLEQVKLSANEHKLEHSYSLWAMVWSNPGNRDEKDYVNNLQLVTSFASVEQWWSIYSHMIRIDSLPPYTELSLFKQGIVPMWEDPANINGGRWMIRIDKESGSRAWEDISLAVLGEQFMVGNEICGISASQKKHEVKLTVWNRTANDNITNTRIRDTIKKLLKYATFNRIEYSSHLMSAY